MAGLFAMAGPLINPDGIVGRDNPFEVVVLAVVVIANDEYDVFVDGDNGNVPVAVTVDATDVFIDDDTSITEDDDDANLQNPTPLQTWPALQQYPFPQYTELALQLPLQQVGALAFKELWLLLLGNAWSILFARRGTSPLFHFKGVVAKAKLLKVTMVKKSINADVD
ncbi:8630_t:CDS:2 [Ambispora gerdemannii]|uniref:8630_t:CDS:1 n=1 Tax=Ambispora gerdemannii TaxID=144530 RepID=A0A9N9FFF1_9GLOM|nr:8630_t:CDS:2 [Ambispora gerdemannii]